MNDRLFSLFFGFRAIGCAVLLSLAAGCASTSIPLGRGSVSIPRKGWRLDAQEPVVIGENVFLEHHVYARSAVTEHGQELPDALIILVFWPDGRVMLTEDSELDDRTINDPISGPFTAVGVYRLGKPDRIMMELHVMNRSHFGYHAVLRQGRYSEEEFKLESFRLPYKRIRDVEVRLVPTW